MNESFILRQTGSIGQEIISPQGNVIAWTTDPVIGALLIRILNDHFSKDESIFEKHENL